MWVLTSSFALTTLILMWLCAAYFVILRFISFLNTKPVPRPPEELPSLSVVVPCYNEAPIILDKLRNLLACDYPAEKLEIVFVDGGSTDRTVELLRSALPPDRAVRLSLSPRKGKIQQLNHVLPTLRGRYIVISDADARMPPDTLMQLTAEFARDQRTWVVGAYSHAPHSIWRDRCFWDSQNRGRLIESDAHSSSIVIATCYAFRRELISEFPDDVVADDVYVGLLANSFNHRVVYSRRVVVEEQRGPSSISGFLSHKFRKNNAFLRESLRFLHRLPDMSGYGKMMILTRTAQQLLLPWAAGLWSVQALTVLTLGRLDLFMVAAGSLALSIMIARQAFRSVDVPPGTTARFGLLKYAMVYFETMFVLFAAALSYPFFRQGSSYARLPNTLPPQESPPPTDPPHVSTVAQQSWADLFGPRPRRTPPSSSSELRGLVPSPCSRSGTLVAHRASGADGSE